MSDTNQELYKILADYADDLKAVKKRDGKLPADAAVARITRLVNEARLHENQMGLDLHIAIKNGLEQQSENAQLTATWKANEQIIQEFKLRIEQLKATLQSAERRGK